MFSVLYVDDEPALLKLGKLFLERTSEFQVDVAISAIDALASPAFPSYDVIVSDYQMPGMDGIAFLKIVRERFGDIPFILFTGRGREDVVIEAINNGADFYLQKGGDAKPQFAELSHKIRQAMARRQAEHSLRESEKRLADIINFLPDATFAINREGVIIAWNRAIDEMTGLSAEMMLGKGDHEYALPFYGERRPILIDLIFEPSEVIELKYSHIIRQKDVLIADTNLPRLQGREVTLVGKASPLYNSQGEVVGAIEAIRDITEQKRAEYELQVAYEQITASEGELREQLVLQAESEAKYRELAELLPQIVFEMDRNLIITFVNRQGYTALGFTPEDVLQGFNALSIVDPLQHACIRENFKKIINKESHEPLEYSLMRKDGSTFPALIYSEPVYKNGALSGFRGIIIDISDRKKTENALHESEATQLSIFRAAPVGIGLVSNRVLLRANDRLCEMTGYSAEELIGRSARILYPDDEEFERVGRDKYEPIRKFGTGTVETRWQRKDGELREILLSSTPLDPENHATGVTFTALDITDRKRADYDLHSSWNLMQSIFDAVPDLLIVVNRQFRILYSNFKGHDSITLMDPDKCSTCFGRFKQLDEPCDDCSALPVFETGETVQREMMNPADGRIREVRAFPIHDSSGKVSMVVEYVRDITDQKRAEQELLAANEQWAASQEELQGQFDELVSARDKLQKSQEQLDEITRTVPGVVYQFYARPDDRMGVHYVSSRAGEVFGFDTTTQDFFAWFTRQVDPRDRETFLNSINDAVRLRSPWDFEGLFIKPSGEKIWFQGISRPVARQGELVSSGVLLDITQRKLTEVALHESEEKYRTLVETTGTGFVIIDEKGLVLDANPEYIRLSGHKNLKEIAGRSVTEWTAAYEKGRNEAAVHQCIRDGYIRNLEIDYVNASGTIIPVEINATVLPHGDTVRILTLCRNISERRITQEALRESEAKYRTVIEQSHDGIFIAQNGLLIFHNPSFATMTGYSSAELAGRSIDDLIVPEDRELVLTRHKERLLGKVLPEVYDFSVLHHDGTSRIRVTMNITSATIGGRPATIGTLHNVTEERKREEAFLESEARLSSILHGSPTLQFVIDNNHLVISWNKAIEHYSGIKAEDIVGTDQQWRAFYPEKRPVLADLLVDEKNEDIPKFYGGKFSVSRLVESAYEATDFFPAMGASGKWLNFTAAPIRDAQGTIIGAVETLEDISERRIAEQAVLEANHKLNLLNSITRHDVANQLTILLGYAQIAAMKKGDPVTADYLAKIITAADTITHQIEFTRMYQELGAREPAWTMLEEVIARVESRVPVTFSGTCRGIEIFSDPMLERVFFNLFDNAVYHGGRVTEITVRCKRVPDGILVIVEDNGHGIPAAEKEKIFERGVGKNTGLGLFLVKEILSITGIMIKETGEPGQGAQFEMVVPENAWRIYH